MTPIDFIYSLNKTQQIINNQKSYVSESSIGYNLMLIAAEFLKGSSTVFVVLPTLYLAQKYYDELTNIIDEKNVLFFPSDELLSVEMISASGDFLYERIQTIYSLLTDEKKVVIMNMHSAIRYEMNKDVWLNNFYKIEVNKSYNINKLVDNLTKLGYVRVSQVTKTKEYSRRGSILDIFPLGYNNPIRLDFFGDDLETIKEFDTLTQRSINKINDFILLPVSELIYDKRDYEFARNNIMSFLDNFELSPIEDEMYKKDLFNLSEHESLETLIRYIEFFDNTKTNIFDFSNNKRIYFIDFNKMKELYNKILLDLDEYATRMSGYSLTKMNSFNNINDILKLANVNIYGLTGITDDSIKINSRDIEPYNSNPKKLIKDLAVFRFKKTLLSISNRDRIRRLKDLLDEEGIILKETDDISNLEPGILYVTTKKYPSLNLIDDDLLIIDEETIFDNTVIHKAKYKSIYKNAQKITRFDELELHDYVVHYNYGIGIYNGIKTITMKNIKRDYIEVLYKNNASLYISLENLSSLSKYASKDTEGVLIHGIGDASWARTKARVRKRIHDISDKLIKLYAERRNQKGYHYPPDDKLQYEFENEFEYDLTEDQIKAVKEIKADMESDKCMDRLVCGDVGYGKTEVALRAAFKAVLAGKQVILLCPTTILARQHYHTFKDRMDKYGIRVELLSRFVEKKKQDNIIEGLFFGSVDVCIGTHRLLSNEIGYKDLGLLIIDEEQRFGVTHKEKIKELKVNVDCITLTATPIPRTLQMSIMGIKDLSMIETPPKNRYPIQTYVLERNDRIITDAIEREIARGGQVFYLYNYTETIIDQLNKLKSLVPEARIAVGHGKLSKDQLESVIQSFLDKKYDVLLCTTIIETGIDIPETNTLIIHDADKLGLSQMYQIRGRVGRSNKIAYAYLMYEPRKSLTDEAIKRLETIKEFNELGSGYKIAMRDLSIRGSGDLLGEEQSGYVESVGIDMYLKILDEEINNKKEEPEANKFTEALVSRTINENYIETDDLRIKIHKRIDLLNTLDELNELVDELNDRFGKPDDELLLYMYEKLMDNYAKSLNIYKIVNEESYIELYFTNEMSKKVNGDFLFTNLPKNKLIDLFLTNQFEIYIKLRILNNKLVSFKEICKYLDILHKKYPKN